MISAQDENGELIYGIGPTTKSAFTDWYTVLYEHEVTGGNISDFLSLLKDNFEDFNIIRNRDGSKTKGARKDYFRDELEIVEAYKL